MQFSVLQIILRNASLSKSRVYTTWFYLVSCLAQQNVVRFMCFNCFNSWSWIHDSFLMTSFQIHFLITAENWYARASTMVAIIDAWCSIPDWLYYSVITDVSRFCLIFDTFFVNFGEKLATAQWFKTSWNRVVSTGPPAHPLARSLLSSWISAIFGAYGQ